MALAFRDDEALRVVLTSGLCPPDVQAAGARVAQGRDGGLVLAPDRPLARPVLAALRAAGVATDVPLPADARAVRCWAEAVALARAPNAQLPALALLTAPAGDALVELAAELLRLGCDRQELQIGDSGGVIRAIDPPTYTMMRALDHDAGIRAYAPDPAGQDAVFSELGYQHPLANKLAPAPGHLLLLGADGWRTVEDRRWRSLDTVLELAIPAGSVELAAARLTPADARRRVELRLAPGRRDAPSLWVIRQGGLAAIDRLLSYLPEEVVSRLTFAAIADAADGGPMIVLRARTSRHPPPDLSLDAEVYAPLAQLPDVYAPAGAIVEPPLRRERLRAILGADTGHVTWLAPVGPRGFRVERIGDAAFAPLGEWAEYVMHASARELAPWTRAALFDFAAFVSTGLEWASSPPPGQRERAPAKERGRSAKPRGEAVAQPVAAAPPAPPPPRAPGRREVQPAAAPLAIDVELAALENEFLALDAPADAPERLVLLARLGGVYLRLGRRRDAGLCFARAVWELSGPAADAQLDAWLAAALGRTPAGTPLDAALATAAPATDDVRLVAALTARAGADVRRDPHRVQRWLDDHDGELDARSLWLARLGLARLAGGDALGLATARDRILARLAGGLPAERELPSFLRFAGRSGVLGNASGEQLAGALQQIAQRIETTQRKRSPVEAPLASTNAYASLQLAHGFARIGMPDRARALVASARTALGAAASSDPVHAYLTAAFAARVEQAIAGQPAETPLPDLLGAQLAALERVERYKVDRLREASRILEPVERPDAIGAFSRRQHDARGPEFAALRAEPDLALRATEVGRLVGVAAQADEVDRARLLDGCFDVMLELPEAHAVPSLSRAVPVIATLPEPRRAVLYAEALVVAGHFARTELIPELLGALSRAIRDVAGNELDRVLDQSLRALRRIGLRHEIAELLADAEHRLAAGATHLRARLALAGGLAFLGDTARALPILGQARTALGEAMNLTNRLELSRALAQAYSQAPLAHALSGIAELSGQLRDITDSFGTNSHYCLSVLHFVESLVLGVTSDDLALGEVGRRFVEDDEHLIRRRLHRDLSTPQGGSS